MTSTLSSPAPCRKNQVSPITRGFRPDIQGLRAIAVLLVVLHHAGLPGLGGGYVGVDIFFVISGFLISSQLISGLDKGTFHFFDFYARRVRRILPASLFVLVVTMAAAWALLPPLQLQRVFRDAAWTAVYLPNVAFYRQDVDYLAVADPSLFQHYWSLGVEEQFYFFWPLILFLLYRVSSKNIRLVTGAMALLVLVSFAGSVWMTPEHQSFAFFMLPTRAWELGVGGLLAMFLLHRTPVFPERVKYALASLGLVLIVVSALLYDEQTIFPSFSAALPVTGAALIILAGPQRGFWAKVLQNRIMQWVGDISYSLYLWHWPLLMLPVAMNSWQPIPLWMSALLGAFSLPVAWLSYTLIETPFRRIHKPVAPPLRPFLNRGVPLPISAAFISAIVVAGLSLSMVQLVSQDLSAKRIAPELAVTEHPVSPDFVGANLSVDLGNARSEAAVPSGKGCHLDTETKQHPKDCTYGSGQAALDVALVGDSHAAQWAPAFESLATQGHFNLVTYTRDACSLHDRSLEGGVKERQVCLTWKQQVIDKLQQVKPEVIVLTHSIQSMGGIKPSVYRESIKQLLAKLPQDSKIVLLRDTPRFAGDPVSCLSANLDNPAACEQPKSKILNTEIFAVDTEMSDSDPTRVTTLDLSKYLCADTCPVVQGNVLVFKDQQHLSKTFTKAFAPSLWKELSTLLQKFD